MMKKIILFLMCFISITAQSQNLEKYKFLDNTYIGVSTGVFGWPHSNCNGFDNFGKSIKSSSSIKLGKMITPIFGLELDGEIGMANQIKFVDHTNVGLNMLFNLNNASHPYRGEPDNIEFVPFMGIGWHHTYGSITNNISSKFGMQVNFNIGERKAWQVNVIPSINYIMTDDGISQMPSSQPRLDLCRSFVNLQVGFTYKFKNSKGTHNFVISPYIYTQSEIDELMNKINKQRKEIKRNYKVIHKLKRGVDSLSAKPANDVPLDIQTTIGFNIGKSEINSTQRGNLIRIANLVKNNDIKIKIIGYADKNTGSDKRNLTLSKMRAESVANELYKLGVKKDSIIISGVGSTQQVFDENDANRVVIFTVTK